MKVFNFNTSEYQPVNCSVDKKVYAFKTSENISFLENKELKIIKCFPVNDRGELDLISPIEISNQYLFSLSLKNHSSLTE